LKTFKHLRQLNIYGSMNGIFEYDFKCDNVNLLGCLKTVVLIIGREYEEDEQFFSFPINFKLFYLNLMNLFHEILSFKYYVLV